MGLDFTALTNAAKTDPAAAKTLNTILSSASATSFRAVAVLPLILLVIFGEVWLYDKSRGGYKAIRLDTGLGEEATPE